MAARRGHTGTNIRREWDVAALSRSLRAEGIDPRHWVSYGTVGTFDGDSGEANFGDSNAVWVGPEGVEVDVILEPAGIPVTCKYYGIQGGSIATMLAPIVPGDIVLVAMPDGHAPVIQAILNSANVPLPLEQDRKPVFRNDKVSLYVNQVPIEIRTAGGARLVMAQDGTINANQGENGVARLQDHVEVTLSGLPAAPDGIWALAAALLATGLFTPNPAPPPPSQLPDFKEHGEISSASDTVKAG